MDWRGGARCHERRVSLLRPPNRLLLSPAHVEPSRGDARRDRILGEGAFNRVPDLSLRVQEAPCVILLKAWQTPTQAPENSFSASIPAAQPDPLPWDGLSAQRLNSLARLSSKDGAIPPR